MQTVLRALEWGYQGVTLVWLSPDRAPLCGGEAVLVMVALADSEVAVCIARLNDVRRQVGRRLGERSVDTECCRRQRFPEDEYYLVRLDSSTEAGIAWKAPPAFWCSACRVGLRVGA